MLRSCFTSFRGVSNQNVFHLQWQIFETLKFLIFLQRKTLSWLITKRNACIRQLLEESQDVVLPFFISLFFDADKGSYLVNYCIQEFTSYKILVTRAFERYHSHQNIELTLGECSASRKTLVTFFGNNFFLYLIW